MSKVLAFVFYLCDTDSVVTQYANPTAINKGEPAEPVLLSNTAYDGKIVMLRATCYQVARGSTNQQGVMTMKISATFSDGTTISRVTIKPLTHAYKSVNVYQTFTGFATSEELARKAATNVGKKVPKPFQIEVVLTQQGE